MGQLARLPPPQGPPTKFRRHPACHPGATHEYICLSVAVARFHLPGKLHPGANEPQSRAREVVYGWASCAPSPPQRPRPRPRRHPACTPGTARLHSCSSLAVARSHLPGKAPPRSKRAQESLRWLSVKANTRNKKLCGEKQKEVGIGQSV